MMRVSTANAFATSIDNLQTRQGELVDAQTRMTSGKRVMQACDDPTAAARAERARAALQRTDSTQRAIDASQNAMSLTESALADAGDLIGQARDLLLSAGSASMDDSQRAVVAKQISSIRQQLLAVANRGDGNGGHVFSGQGSGAAPFVDRAGGVAYSGSGGSVQAASDESLPLTLDGGQVWLSAPSGNGVFETHAASNSAWIDGGQVTSPQALTGANYQIAFSVVGGQTTYSVLKDGGTAVVSGAPYTSGQAIEFDGLSVAITGAPAAGDHFDIAPSQPDTSIFDTLDQAVRGLQTPGQAAAAVTQTVQDALHGLDASSTHLQGLRGMAGEVLKRIDAVQGRLADTKLEGETLRSNAEDLDMTQAISDFQTKQTGYQAALQTYASMQKLSLFTYIQA
jgi:flagellar hook-associated protein 3 FlgL